MDEKTRICKTCGKEKDIAKFPSGGNRQEGGGYKYRYRECAVCRERQKKDHCLKVIYAAYGKVCGCCGETCLTFLTIDHLQDDGNKHRWEVGKTHRANIIKVLRDIIRQGCPPDKYGVRCFNCNCGRRINGGICPHQLRAVV